MKSTASKIFSAVSGKKAILHLTAAFALCLMTITAVHAQDGRNRWMRINNESSFTLVSFQASNVDRSSWEEDILGRRVLLPGYFVNVNIFDGTGHCFYDLKATFSNGNSVVRRDVNVCGISAWTITDDTNWMSN